MTDFAPHKIERHDQIPDAPAYVVMRDPFFSGWGPATDKHAIYVYACESREEAKAVVKVARERGDQDWISTVHKKDAIMLGPDRLVQLKTRENSPVWYPAREEAT